MALLASAVACTSAGAQATEEKSWAFVSIPDFLNFDIECPQKGWGDALGFIIGSMMKEDPALTMVSQSHARPRIALPRNGLRQPALQPPLATGLA